MSESQQYERQQYERDIREERDFATRIMDTLQESLLVLEPDLRIRSANRAFFEKFKLPPGDTEGRRLFELGHGEWDIPELRQILTTGQPLEDFMHQVVVERQFPRIGKQVLSINVRSLEEGRLILLIIDDMRERRENERRQEILLAELQHRVKNILASVQAVARMTHQRSTTLAEFWNSFQGRLMALAATQELLTRARTERVSLTELVERELTAQGARPQDYKLDGPPLNLTPKSAENLALAFHELTTNATKHGALSQPGGRIEVAWQVENDHVRFQWIEEGGPLVQAPKRRGFGVELMEKAIPYQLRGKTKLEFPPEGLRCTIDFGVAGNVQPPPDENSKAARNN